MAMSVTKPIFLFHRSNLITRRLFLAAAAASVAARRVDASNAQAQEAASSTVPATWRPWLLDTADQVRPADPGLPTDEERMELLDLQSTRTAATAVTVSAWGDGPAVLPWSD
jgi:hypothetical protein